MTRTAVAGLMLFAAHLAAVLWHFPVRHADPLDPLATGDLSITLGKAWDVAGNGRLAGYSPSYMAGYPLGLWNSVGHRGYELGTTHLPFGSPATNYFWTVVGMAVLSPLVLALSAWAGGCRFVTALGCLGGASVMMQVCDPVSYFWTFGNAGFVFGSSGAVLASGLALPKGGRLRLSWAALAGLVAGIAVVVHTVAVVPVACGGLAAIVVSRQTGVSWGRLLARVSVAVAVAGAVAGPAYVHLFGYLDQRADMPIKPLPSGIKYLLMDLFNDRAYLHPMDRRPFFHVLLVLAAWAGTRERTGPAFGLSLAGALVLLFGYAAGHLPGLKELQPYRFVVSGELFLSVPACLGLRHFWTAFQDANPSGKAAILAVATMFAPSLIGYVWDLPGRGRAGGLDADSRACAEWFRDNPSPGRVLCEPGSLGAVFPHLTGRSVIGGAVGGQAVLIQNWAHVGDGRAFGRPINEIPPTEFVRLLRALDVRQVITVTPEFDLMVHNLPTEFIKEKTIGPLTVYRLTPRAGPDIWDGVLGDKVQADFNYIQVTDPPIGRFVLPYHYMKGFRAEAGVTIEPATVPGAGAPFIAVTVSDQRPMIKLIFNP